MGGIANKLMPLLDSDGDGLISVDEFAKGFKILEQLLKQATADAKKQREEEELLKSRLEAEKRRRYKEAEDKRQQRLLEQQRLQAEAASAEAELAREQEKERA